MTWRPGGGGGGAWELYLQGKTALVAVRDDRINDLDRLYAPEVDDPKTLHDYGHPGTLVDDAFWRLVDLFLRQGALSRGKSE
jgi:hypothetical protein